MNLDKELENILLAFSQEAIQYGSDTSKVWNKAMKSLKALFKKVGEEVIGNRSFGYGWQERQALRSQQRQKLTKLLQEK